MWFLCCAGERRSAIDPEMWNNISSLTFAFNIDIATPKNTTQQVYIESATLKLYKLRVKPHNMRNRMSVDDQVRVNVYQLLSDIANVTNGTQDIRKLLDSRLVSLETLGWEKFDISSAVDVWLRHPERNFGVEVACHHQVLGAVVEFAIPSADWQDAELRRELTPHVDVYSRRKPVQARRKRSDEKFDCTQGDGEQRCCRYPLWISFEHIGWSGWVVAPDGYKAYYCDGTCPYRYKIAHTFAAIQSLINKNNPSAVPAPCCTAAKLSPFTLLHYNNKDQLVVSVYDDMVIDECMCAWRHRVCVTSARRAPADLWYRIRCSSV